MGKLHEIVELASSILKAKEESLEREFKDSHYENSPKLVAEVKVIQDGMEDAINEFEQGIVAEWKQSGGDAHFMNELRRRMKEDDELFLLLFSFLSGEFPAFVRGEVRDRLKREYTNGTELVTQDLFSMQAIYDSLLFARLTARTKADGVVKRILEIAEDEKVILTAALTEDEALSRKRDCRRTAIESVETLYHIGQIEAWRQNPNVIGKRWVHEMNEKLHRQGHIEMDGQTRSINEPFTMRSITGEALECQYPRDPSLPPSETIRCHCQMIPVRMDSSLMYPGYVQKRQVDDADARFKAWATEDELSLVEAWKEVHM